MILLFSNLSQAQNENYERSWKEVEAFEKEGLPKSALKTVEAIALQAKKDDNQSQVIKTMLFKSKYALVLEEDAQLSIINNFKSEIAQSEFPTKNILESYLANLYWQFFQQNRSLCFDCFSCHFCWRIFVKFELEVYVPYLSSNFISL